jgi:Tol biopolymer transport system component
MEQSYGNEVPMNRSYCILFVFLLAAAGCVSAEDTIPVLDQTGLWGTYSRNGEIYINEVGTPEEKPVTSGHSDMKPSWSVTGDRIVFFRVTKFSGRVSDWTTAICIINTDGTGFQQLTSGQFADFNPSWTRDGSNRIFFSRFDPRKNRSYVYLLDPANGPGSERMVSDPKKSEGATTSLKDGRILVSSNRAVLKGVYYFLTPGDGPGKGLYEPVNFNYRLMGFMDRCSFSPGETKVTYEYKTGWKSFDYLGKTIMLADFDVETLTVSDPRPISPSRSFNLTLYPRFVKDESAVIYHCNVSGKAQLYLYRLSDGKTFLVSDDPQSDYEFFCGEDSPK